MIVKGLIFRFTWSKGQIKGQACAGTGSYCCCMSLNVTCPIYIRLYCQCSSLDGELMIMFTSCKPWCRPTRRCRMVPHV